MRPPLRCRSTMSATSSHHGSKHFTIRVRGIAGIFLFLALVCVGRLYYLQIIKGSEYAARADHEFTTPANPLFDRNNIYFTTKDGTEIAAAVDQNGVSLAVQPPKITDPNALYAALNAIVPLDKNTFMALAQKQGTQYVVVADHLSTTTGAAIQAANLTGVVVAQDSWRSYPGGSLAAQTIGFVAYNGDALEGRYGLERQYESTLQRAQEDLYTNFFVQLFVGATQVWKGTTQGDIVTTIEPSVQAELERELVLYMQQWKPQIAGGIIMDPQNGEIYAMAVDPTFDLNDSSKQTNVSIFNDPLVGNDYEMGSIIKPLTMAAGIDSGAITATTTYNDTGCITVNTGKICNFDLKARGVIPMQQILSQSLNVGASFIATQLGPDRMRQYFKDKYAFGQPTGIDLPGEASGLINNLNSPRQVEYDTASFGQGIAITPIETVRALAALGNGGRLVTPHVARAVRDAAGLEEPLSWNSGTQILSPTTTQQVTQMLTNVVDVAFTKGMSFEHYSVAAKTGTAQISNPAGGGYYSDKYLHSYFGYFPSYNAKFIIFLFAFEPVGAPYSSETWGTTFHNIVQFLINYYAVPPDR